MAIVKVLVEFPEELVERAEAVGMTLDMQASEMIAFVEARVRKREAVQELRAVARELQALPDELKPTSEEIEAEIRAYWQEAESGKA